MHSRTRRPPAGAAGPHGQPTATGKQHPVAAGAPSAPGGLLGVTPACRASMPEPVAGVLEKLEGTHWSEKWFSLEPANGQCVPAPPTHRLPPHVRAAL